MDNGIWLVMALVGAFVSLAVASSKRRNPLAWFAIGFVLPLISVVAICCLPSLAPADDAGVQPS
jgi:hypothetical protein